MHRYLENTGLMWESAEEFGALLVFAEHRCVLICGQHLAQADWG